MSSQFETKARYQTILLLWMFAAPMFALLLHVLTKGADHTTVWFWAGLCFMLLGYAALVRSKWDQIQKYDFFSWGLSPSAKRYRSLYVLSYVMMTGGLVLAGVSGTV